MSDFDAMEASLKRIEASSKKTEEYWNKIAEMMSKAADKGGKVGGTGGQRGHGRSRGLMDGATASVSGGASDEELKRFGQMKKSAAIMHPPMNRLTGDDATHGKLYARMAGTRTDSRGNVYSGKFDDDGMPSGGAYGFGKKVGNLLPGLADRIDVRQFTENAPRATDRMLGRMGTAIAPGIRSTDAFIKSGGTFGAMTYSTLPQESQARIQSSMYGISDTLSLMRGISSASSQFMPDVGATMNRATNYYNATLYGANQRSRNDTRGMTYDTMANLQGITSPGSDADVAQFLASRGMSASKDAGSTYQQTLRTVANAGRYMNISNQEAVASVEGMTSAKGSAETLRNFGIYTADLTTGKEKTQAQIFEELAQRLTAGRGQATVEQTQASIRRGALGVTIDSFFQGDQQGGQMFKQYMLERASGKKMDLSQTDKMAQPADNRNPLNAQYELTQKETGAMNFAESPYISGINMATKALGLLTDVSGGLVQALGGATAMIQTLFGNKRVKGLTEGLTTVVDFASKGVSGIGNAIANMDMTLPPYSTAPALLEAGAIGTSMAASLGAAAAIGGASIGLGNLGGTGGPEGSLSISSGNRSFSARSKATSSKYSGNMGMGKSYKKLSSKKNSGGPIGSTDGSGLYSGSAPSAAGPTAMFNFDYLNGVNISTQYGVVDEDHSSPHGGTDFAMAAGTSVKAVGSGTVVFAGENGGYGNVVAIAHTGSNGRTITSIYAHLSQINVSEGQQVAKGDEIGLVGSTGHSTGPHLHLEFRSGSGFGGATMSMTEAGKMLTNGENSDGSVWTNGSGSEASSTAAYASASAAAVAEAKKLQQTPAAATNAMNILQGLYSGNQSSILSSVKQMAANMGVSAADWNKYMAAQTGASPSSPSAPPGGFRPPNAGGTPINNNVSITVQVPDVTSADAIKFGQLVKQYLDNNMLTSNTGGI